MPAKSDVYLANADKCEQRASEMPPALRSEFLKIASHWRKLAKDEELTKRSPGGTNHGRRNALKDR
jgi:hypothetical protein